MGTKGLKSIFRACGTTSGVLLAHDRCRPTGALLGRLPTNSPSSASANSRPKRGPPAKNKQPHKQTHPSTVCLLVRLRLNTVSDERSACYLRQFTRLLEESRSKPVGNLHRRRRRPKRANHYRLWLRRHRTSACTTTLGQNMPSVPDG